MRALRLFATLSLLSIVGMATAQDVIVKKDQSTVMSKVLEITSTEIKYKKWNNQDGPTYSIDRSEVACINYENGEVEKFSDSTISQPNTYQQQTQQAFKGFMEQSGSHLKLNGHILSDTEVQSLVGEQDYQLYLTGKRQRNTGNVLCCVGGVVIGSGFGVMLRSPTSSSNLDDTETSLKVGLITILIGVVFIPPGAIFSSIGGNKLQQIAEKYNLNRDLYSLNISPTLMSCDIPQSQGNYGLGLTLSMNF